ncbi:hypothetical protein HPB52_006489 [Rhipicephalus sanguineus]|uniref:Uncharacterized protein n=1 Tax=Rhipicephalus sanguineus TaxID=34632 RepID=A0A9D4QH21_RHISA|nr:hypothetical protein HPB52_006489 [Rhipicephalus sanguineus]
MLPQQREQPSLFLLNVYNPPRATENASLLALLGPLQREQRNAPFSFSATSTSSIRTDIAQRPMGPERGCGSLLKASTFPCSQTPRNQRASATVCAAIPPRTPASVDRPAASGPRSGHRLRHSTPALPTCGPLARA